MNDIADHAHRLAGARATQQTAAASAAKVRAEADALEARLADAQAKHANALAELRAGALSEAVAGARMAAASRQRCARRSPRVSGLAASMRTVRMPTPWRDTGARPNRCAAPLLRGRCRPLTRPAYRLSPRRSSPNEARFSRKSERHAHRQCAKLLQLNLVAQ